MGEIDPAFVQAIEHRPKQTIVEAGEIPLIDLSLLNDPDTFDDPRALAGLVAQIVDACKNWGFFQVINHGAPSDLLRGLLTAGKFFFDLPLEEKRKVRRDEENPLGYFDTEHTKNVRDWKEVFDFMADNGTDPGSMAHNALLQYLPFLLEVQRLSLETVYYQKPASYEPTNEEHHKLINQWPECPPQLREACEEYGRNVEKLSYKLLELISMSLGLPAKRFNGFFKEQTSFIRLNHYPPCPTPELTLGVGRHNDAGALTVLAQDDVGGLEVKRKTDGEWIRVKPIPNSYIINVGDISQVWSNDKYASAEHRVVVNSERESFSIPFFFTPSYYTIVKPIEELINDENPAKYKEFNWGMFLSTRKNSNFKKLEVENLQIHHFKIN
ncbi:hypothetical protein HHK36_002510 [Tetracentron sinense]|uniref:Fe2OG dioxygenase domain-containing protein n=1 Tax=Tetracentron sinense TaxID=13715 RepID=A0A834ZQW9_TETSI|nr:hypothetical protein HHK36_002510 [Tetracentron sinense]